MIPTALVTGFIGLTVTTLASSSSETAMPTNYYSKPQTPGFRPVFPITVAGQADTPKLSHAQLTAIRRVLTNTYWKQRRHHLFFALNGSDAVVIFFAEDSDLQASGEPRLDSSYYAVGEGCRVRFYRDERLDEIILNSTSGLSCYWCYKDPLVPNEGCNAIVRIAPKDKKTSKYELDMSPSRKK